MRRNLIVSVGIAGILSGTASAAFVIPTSYTATPGEGQAEGGTYNYFDDTGRQLADGLFGVDDWTADLGNGHAYEWVGWCPTEPTVTFTFAMPVTVQRVSIGFNRGETAGIYLSMTVTIGGDVFTLAGSELADNTRGDLDFAGSWTGGTLAVSLTDNDPARWIFVDEVRFEAIPEPRALTLAVGLGLAGGVLLRRCRRA